MQNKTYMQKGTQGGGFYMVIQHNILAMYGNHVLGKSSGAARKSTEKLSSGYKINRAGDNAAGLAISEKMRGQIRGLDRTIQNAEDGISMVQTADSAMAEIEDLVHRMRELSVQAANDTNTTSDRQAIQEEINELSQEIIRTADDTEFNTRKILKGSKQKTTKSVTGKIDDLRKVYNSVKNVQKIETMVSEQVKIPGGYTKSSMPGWALGTDPLYGATNTTKTGNLTEEIDLGEKEYKYTLTYEDSSNVALDTVASSKYIYNSTPKLSQVKLWNDPVTWTAMVTKTFDDGTTADETFQTFRKNNREASTWLTSLGAEADGSKILNYKYTATPDKSVTHNGGVMDFSNLNKDNIFDLVDGSETHGFNATCTACSAHYSISFVAGTGSKGYRVPNESSYVKKSTFRIC